MSDSVLREIKSHVVFITLNNPQGGNVVNNDNLELIYQYVAEANNDNECRLIVIRGKDGVFCRGMDFKNLLKNADAKIENDFSEPYKKAVLAIRNSDKPVIACVDGDVVAGGMGILLSCDIVIATPGSIFGLSEVLFGIIPAYVYPFLLERVSYKKARYMVLSSKIMDAKTAYEAGIVDEIVEEERLEKKLKEYIKRILFSSPDALRLVKRYSDKLTENKIDEAVDFAQKQLTELLNDKNNLNAIRSFLEGEKPSWALSYK